MTFHLNPKSLGNRLFCLQDIGRTVDGGSFDVGTPFGNGQHLTQIDWITIPALFPSTRRGGRLLSRDARRGHLPACHPVNAVVDKDRRDVLSPGSRVNRLGCPDGGNVPVPLICENDSIRHGPLQSGRQGRSPPVGGFSHIDIKIVVGQYGTPCRRNTNDSFLKIQIIDYLSDEPVKDAMATPRTIVEWSLFQRFGSGEYLFHSYRILCSSRNRFSFPHW